MEIVKALWMLAGCLGAIVVIVLLAYILVCIVKTIAAQVKKEGGSSGR